jgi:histidine triad (HIT) family protein
VGDRDGRTDPGWFYHGKELEAKNNYSPSCRALGFPLARLAMSLPAGNHRMKTIFQKIIDREIPAKFAYEDELCVAIHDVNPQAPVHVLVIPRQPLPRLAAAKPADQALLGHLLLTAARLAVQLGIDQSGYRIVINNGRDGGESVPHLHVHLLGQRPLAWPPG